MKKFLILLVTIAFISSVLLMGIGCTAESAGTEQVAGTEAAGTEAAGTEVTGKDFAGTTIRVLSNTEPWGLLVQYAVEQGIFQEETGINVELELISQSEMMQKTKLELSKGSSQYDVVSISSYDSAVYYSNDWVEDLDALEKSSGISFDRDSFIPGILQSAPCQWNGVTVGLPTSVSTNGVLLYRKDLMENQQEKDAFKAKYGYDLVPPKSWDEYYDIAEFFTRDTDNDGEIDFWGNAQHLDAGGAMFDAWFSPYVTMGLESDADPDLVNYCLNAEYQPVFNKTAGVKAIEFLKKMYDADYIYPGSLSMTWTQITEPFKFDGAFMAYGWAEDAVAAMLPENNDYYDKLAWAPMPFEADPRIIQGGWVLNINKMSENKEAALKFISWVTGAEAEAIMLKDGGYFKLPERQVNFDNPDIMKGYEFYSVVGDMLLTYDVGSEVSKLPETDLVKQVLNVALQRVIVGEKTAQQSLDDAADEVVQGLTDSGAYDRLK